jgi:hypothetical protein
MSRVVSSVNRPWESNAFAASRTYFGRVERLAHRSLRQMRAPSSAGSADDSDRFSDPDDWGERRDRPRARPISRQKLGHRRHEHEMNESIPSSAHLPQAAQNPRI